MEFAEKLLGTHANTTFDKRAIDQRIHELKREIEKVEKLKNVSMIVANDDGSIITVQRDE